MSDQDILLGLSLGVFPLAYLGLCLWMRETVANPPWLAFFFIFGSLAGYLLLCTVLMPSPVGLLVVLPYMLIAYGVLIGVFISTLIAQPRTGFHIAASICSGLIVIPPVVLILFSTVFRSRF